MLVSVIIPVYNVEGLLEKCLKSILSQTVTDFELIIVDDGSTDSSGAICDRFEKMDKRIKVIHQQNQGSSAARNNGLDLANGRFICFVDSDDWVEPHYLQSMIDCSNKEDADMVISSFYRHEVNQKVHFFANKPVNNTKKGLLLDFYNNRLHAGLWNKLIKREILIKNNIRFPQYNYYEDMVFSTLTTIAATSIAYCEIPSYHYVVNEKSMTFQKDEQKRFKLYKECINNFLFIQNIPYISEDTELRESVWKLVNYNKKKLIQYVSDKQILDDAMSLCRESISLGSINNKSDVLFYLAAKYSIYRPLKLLFHYKQSIQLRKERKHSN